MKTTAQTLFYFKDTFVGYIVPLQNAFETTTPFTNAWRLQDFIIIIIIIIIIIVYSSGTI